MTVRVTDHAVLRYMERVQGFNVEAVRAHIAKTVGAAAAAGAVKVRAEGVCFVIGKDSVITVLPKRDGGRR